MNLKNYPQRKRTTFLTPGPCRQILQRCGEGAEKLKVEKLSDVCFLALLSLQIAVGRLPGKGECTDRLVAMDLLFAEIYMCQVI